MITTSTLNIENPFLCENLKLFWCMNPCKCWHNLIALHYFHCIPIVAFFWISERALFLYFIVVTLQNANFTVLALLRFSSCQFYKPCRQLATWLDRIVFLTCAGIKNASPYNSALSINSTGKIMVMSFKMFPTICVHNTWYNKVLTARVIWWRLHHIPFTYHEQLSIKAQDSVINVICSN